MTSRDAKRRAVYTTGNHPPIGISSRINLQPTRSLYDFRFKSYGPLCDFYKSGDLDLDLYPIFTPKKCQGPWNWVHELSNFPKDRTSRVACTSCNYGQTNRQTDKQTDRQTAVTNILCKNLRFCKVTNRGDQYTLQKSTILQSNKQTDRWKGTQRVHTLQNWTYRLSDLPCRLTVTKVKDTINWS